jgi:hypothetical protein
VDEDSSPEALARRVQAAFTKTLTEELKKVNMPAAGSPAQRASMTDGVLAGSELVIDGEFVAIHCPGPHQPPAPTIPPHILFVDGQCSLRTHLPFRKFSML